MSFYGSIISYAVNAFKKIRINKEYIEARNQEDTVEFIGESPIGITPDVANNIITFKHEEIDNDKIKELTLEQNGPTVSIGLPLFDKYGHFNGEEIKQFSVSGGTTLSVEYTEETGDLKFIF